MSPTVMGRRFCSIGVDRGWRGGERASGFECSFCVQLRVPSSSSCRFSSFAKSAPIPPPSVAGKNKKTNKKAASKRPPSAASTLALCRSSWVGPAAAALMQEDLWSRSHVASYLLPEVCCCCCCGGGGCCCCCSAIYCSPWSSPEVLVQDPRPRPIRRVFIVIADAKAPSRCRACRRRLDWRFLGARSTPFLHKFACSLAAAVYPPSRLENILPATYRRSH